MIEYVLPAWVIPALIAAIVLLIGGAILFDGVSLDIPTRERPAASRDENMVTHSAKGSNRHPLRMRAIAKMDAETLLNSGMSWDDVFDFAVENNAGYLEKNFSLTQWDVQHPNPSDEWFGDGSN